MEIEKLKILCIAPAWNEEKVIFDVVQSIPEIVDQIVVVDDGSTDRTSELAEKAGAHVIRQKTNMGVGAAIRSGIDYAIENGFEVVVVISGGGKTPPEQIPNLLKPIFDGKADFVQGSRYLAGGELLNAPFHRRIGTRAYSFLFSALTGNMISDASSGFRAFKTEILKTGKINLWQNWLNKYELEPYLLAKALKLRYNVIEVPVTIKYPQKGKNVKYTKMRKFVDWWKIFRPIVFLFLGVKK